MRIPSKTRAAGGVREQPQVSDRRYEGRLDQGDDASPRLVVQGTPHAPVNAYVGEDGQVGFALRRVGAGCPRGLDQP